MIKAVVDFFKFFFVIPKKSQTVEEPKVKPATKPASKPTKPRTAKKQNGTTKSKTKKQ